MEHALQPDCSYHKHNEMTDYFIHLFTLGEREVILFLPWTEMSMYLIKKFFNYFAYLCSLTK